MSEPLRINSPGTTHFVFFSNTFFCSVASVLIAIVYCLLRSGFIDDSVKLLFPILGTSLFILNSPVFIISIVRRNYATSSYEELLQLLMLFLIVVFGVLRFQISFFIAAMGFLLFGYSIFQLFYSNALNALKLVVLSLFFALLCVCLSWAYSQNTAFLESMAFDKQGYCCYFLDPLFQASVIQMIKTYGVASTGFDGVPYINYHAGSHWILAEMSVFLKIHVVDMVHYAYPVIFIPLFVNVILMFVKRLGELTVGKVEFKPMLYFYVIVILMGFIHIEISRIRLTKYVSGTLRELPTWLASESYLISIIILLAVFSSLVVLYKKRKYLLIALLVPIFVASCALVKISAGYLLFAVLCYLLIRLKLFRKPVLVISMIVTLVCFYFVYYLTVDQKVSEGAYNFFYFFKDKKIFFIPFVVIYFLPAWIAIGMVVYFTKFYSLFKPSITKDRFAAFETRTYTLRIAFSKLALIFRRNRILAAEILLVVIVAAILPTLVMEFNDNALYFTDVSFWVAIVIGLSYTPFLFRPWYKKSAYATRRSMVITCLFILVMCYFIHGYYTSTKRLANKAMNVGNLRVRKLIFGDTTSSSFIREIKNYFRDETKKEELAVFYSSRIEQLAVKNDFYVLLRELKKLDTTDVNKKSQSLVYINHAKLPPVHPLFCYQVPLMIPSLTGMAMINGAPQEGCYKGGYGFEYYAYRSTSDVNHNYTPAELCSKVKAKGFKFLCFYNMEKKKFEWYDCEKVLASGN